MPVYQYEGVHYDLPDGLTNEQAIAKIEQHLGKSKEDSGFLAKAKDVLSGAASTTKDMMGEIGNTLLNFHGMNLDNPSGTAETIGTVGSGMAAMGLGVVPAALGSISNLSHGEPADFEKNYESAIDRMTVKPTTERGQEMTGDVGEFINRNLVPVAPMFGELAGSLAVIHERGVRKAMGLGKPKTPDIAGAMDDIVSGDINNPPADSPPSQGTPMPDVMPVTPEGQGIASPQDAMFKKAAEQRQAEGQANLPENGYEPQSGDPFAQMKQQLGTPQRFPEQNPAMEQMAQRLQGEQVNPLRAQGELFQPDRGDLGLEQQPMDLPPREPRAPVGGEQGEMFGPLMDLEGEAGLGKAPDKGPLVAGEQEPLDLREHLNLDSEGEMAAPKEPDTLPTSDKATPDMFGDNLDLDPNARFANLPKDSIYEQMKREARERMVEDDPRVQAAEKRATAAEEAYLKAAQDFQAGRLGKGHVARMEKDMHALHEALEYVKDQVAQQKIMEASRKPGVPLSQRGAVDITPLRQAVEKAKEVLSKIDIPLVRDALNRFDATNSAKVFSDAAKKAAYEGHPPETVAALKEAYQAASEHTVGEMENAMDAKAKKLPPGPKPRVPGKQRGFILMEAKKQKALQNLTKKADIEVKLGEISPAQWSPADAVENIKRGQDLDQNTFQNLMNYLTKGGQYLAIKTHNAMIRFAKDRFLEEDRLAKADTRDWIYAKDSGLGDLMRNLSKKEQTEAWALINYADMHQKPIDLAKLAERGFSPEVLKFIKGHRAAMDHALSMINKAREASGQEPVDARAAYAAMQSTGDFRAVVYDKKGGNVIGVIGSDFKAKINRLREQMEGKGYFVEKEKYFGGMPRERGSANQAFMHAIEVLADKDPRINDFVKVLDDIRKTEINNFLNMKRHTMEKKGVFGTEGRKEWETAEQNALDGFKTQLNYLEAAIKWGHLSEAFKDVSQVLKHPDTQHMPKAREWSERYMYNALGFNPSDIGRSIETTMALMFKEMGVGFSVARRTMANARYLTNSALLTLKPSFWYQNVIQPLQAMPGMKGDLIARGLDAGFDFGTGYSYVTQGINSGIRVNADVKSLTPFERDAAAYAKKNHVYGADMVEHSNRPRRDAGYWVDVVNDKIAGNIESATRRVMYYSFAHMLKENGMSVKNGLFETAHNLTDMTMNNYSGLERPQMYNALGPAGDLAVNLQSYKHNELSRLSMFVRDSAEHKSLRPIAADLLSRFAFVGVMGMVAYDEVDALFHLATKAFGHPMSLSNIIYKASEGANKYMYDATGGKVDAPYAVSNGIHSLMGLDMSRSLGLTDVVPNNLFDAAFPGGGYLSSNVASAAAVGKDAINGDVNPMNLKRLATTAAPTFAQGELNNQFFTKGEGDNRQALRVRDLKSQATRDNFDYQAKRYGFTGINESVQRQKNYNVETISRDYADLRQRPLDNMRDNFFQTGSIRQRDIQDYIKYRGSPETIVGDIERYATEQRLTPQQIAQFRASASSSVGALLKAQDYLKAYTK